MRTELKKMFFQAEDYLAEGQFSLAIQTYRAALNGTKDTGEQYLALTYIGAAYDDKGDQRMALATFKECQQLAEKSFGRNSLHYAVALSNEAMQYSNRGKAARAEPLLDEAVRICRSTDRSEVAKQAEHLIAGLVEIYSNAGECKARLGKVAEALKLMQDAYRKAKATLPDQHARRLQAALELGALLSCLGRSKEAEVITQEVMRGAQTTMGNPVALFQAFQHAVANTQAFLEGIEQAQIDAVAPLKSQQSSNVVPLLPKHATPGNVQCAGYQLRITLSLATPPIWRRVNVPSDYSLAQFHRIIQRAMGWSNSHLHEFRIGQSRFGDPKQLGDAQDERKHKLADLSLSAGSKIEYEYDFGDSWIHSIVVEKTLNADVLADSYAFVAGKGACPPEDCGGPHGFMHLLDVLQGPDRKDLPESLEEYDPAQLPDCFSRTKGDLCESAKKRKAKVTSRE